MFVRLVQLLLLAAVALCPLCLRQVLLRAASLAGFLVLVVRLAAQLTAGKNSSLGSAHRRCVVRLGGMFVRLVQLLLLAAVALCPLCLRQVLLRAASLAGFLVLVVRLAAQLTAFSHKFVVRSFITVSVFGL